MKRDSMTKKWLAIGGASSPAAGKGGEGVSKTKPDSRVNVLDFQANTQIG
jgi:hypothetical protein